MRKQVKFITLGILFILIFGPTKAQWASFGSTGNTNNFVVDFEYYNNDLYATGLFTQLNGISVQAVAKWTGSTWVQLGSFTDWGHNLVTIDSVMFFTKYRTANDSNYVCYFNGSTWKTLGRAFKNAGSSSYPNLYDIAKYNNELYVCGEFNRCGIDTIKGIAKWNGTKWVQVNGGLSLPMTPYSVIYPHKLRVANGKLYVGGNFQKAGNIICNGIAEWDGANWTSLNNGFNKAVYSICSYNNELYAGGEFTQSGLNVLGNIAKWNGSQWINPGFKVYSTTNYSYVHTMEVIQNNLYVAGGFNKIITTTTNSCGSIILFDGTNVNTLDGGVNNDVEGLIELQPASQNKILVGGQFSSAGSLGLNCSKIATFGFLNVAIEKNSKLNESISIYPNPCNNYLTISSDETIKDYTIFNSLGELIIRENFDKTINTTSLSDGVYFLKLNTINKHYNFIKFVKNIN